MKAKIVLDTRRCKKDGTYPVVIELRNKDKIRISTSYSCTMENWEDGEFTKEERNYQRKSIILRDILNRVERFILQLEDEEQEIADSKLRKRLTEIVSGEEKNEKTFLDCLDEFVSYKEKKGTIEIYNMTRRKIEYFDPRCTFSSIDKKWLMRFEDWLKDGGMRTNAIAIHLRNIRAVFNYAIDEEYTSNYPFRRFTIKKEETRKRSLTADQLRTLRDYHCEDYQIKYRDLFMLMFYLIGINATDLFLARKKDIVDGRPEYKRAKTGKLYSILIQPEAQTIIDRYAGKREYLLDVIDDYANYKDFLHRMNIALQQIGEMKRVGHGGKKEREPLFPDLSSYWSRHTWATIAAQLDIPKGMKREL